VVDALAAGSPVVALESTLISHGLPYPENLRVARASEAAVVDSGAVPATVAIRDGELLVGLDDASLEALACAPAGSVRKAARPTLAAALTADGWAATTVSATMIAAAAAGIDVSSDLEELARTPMVVVCAGPKAILDVPATLEYLETRGVPVVAVGQDEMPGFYARTLGVRAPASVADAHEAAALASAHLELGLGSAVLVCVPAPAESALSADVTRRVIERAIAEADQADIGGPELTPWLLTRIAAITDGASVRANTALIVNNASVAGGIAMEMAAR
jgi:pseudouridine-5'-phosphate glycosidase